jgi:branched-chain amino acid transport system ATP-binding protein
VIRLTDVHARIGAVEILSGISLTAAPGRFVAVIGANGAGKTTLLRVISNLLPASGGRIAFDGEDTAGVAAHDLARSGLVHVPQGRQIIPSLSVEDNLKLGALHVPSITRADVRDAMEREYARFPNLRARVRTAGGNLSGGEQQMLAISRAMMMRPRLLLLDEPSLGLAPLVVELILRALRALADEGMTVLLVEQVAMLSLSIADEGCVLRQGKVVLSGPAGELRRDPGLVESYLS